MGKTQKVITSVSLPPDLVKSLDVVAKQRRLTRSQLIEHLCAESLDRQRVVAAAFADPVVVDSFTRAFAEPGMLRRLAAAMSEDLSDEQLELFTRAVEEASHGVAGVIKRSSSKRKNK